MDPLTIGLLASIPSLALGAWQGIEGYNLGKEKRPDYEIPSSIDAMLGLAENRASQRGLPGQAGIEQGIQTSTGRGASLLERTASGSQLLGGITDLVAGEQGQMLNLGIAGAQERLSADQALQQALTGYAQYQDKKFEINEMQPYLESRQQSLALKDAAIQNIVGGVGAGLGGYAQTQQSNTYLDILKNMYKSQQGVGEEVTIVDPMKLLFSGKSGMDALRGGDAPSFLSGLTSNNNTGFSVPGLPSYINSLFR